MKYQQPAAAICDRCGKMAPTVLHCFELGPISRRNLQLPEEWISEVVQPPRVAVPRPDQVQVQLNAPPAEVAQATGQPVLGIWCSTDCQGIAQGRSILAELGAKG